MSFNFEFYSKQSDAVAIVGEQTAPDAVKAFLVQGLSAFKPEAIVWVKANGHLFNGDYQRSNGDLLVQQVVMRTPMARAMGS